MSSDMTSSDITPIQYEVGLLLDDKQKELWNCYTTENRENYFWMFLDSFVEKWQTKVIPSWELLVTSRLNGGKEIGIKDFRICVPIS